MKASFLAPCAATLLAALASSAGAQIAGSTTIGVTVSETNIIAAGWSAKKQILGRTVYNEKGERVGRVDDLIVAPDKSVSLAIIGAGGFVGLGRHDVAIPVDQFQELDGKFVLDGATKQAIEALPQFEYSKSIKDAPAAADE